MKYITIIAAYCTIVGVSEAAESNTEYIKPSTMYSPDKRYGVMIPIVDLDTIGEKPDYRANKVVELSSQKVIAIIHADPGYDRALNFHETAPPRWSKDSSLLLWKVKGKWNPDALVLLKIEQNRVKWEINLLKTAQQAVLLKTKKAAPKQFEICKKANVGNGSAYPDGFTINVWTDGEQTKTVSLPLRVHANLTSNPKDIENLPNLNSELVGEVTTDAKFIVNEFHVVTTKR